MTPLCVALSAVTGCFAFASVLAGNLRDYAVDRELGVTTLPVRLGVDAARRLYQLAFFAPAAALVPLVAHAGSLWLLLPLVAYVLPGARAYTEDTTRVVGGVFCLTAAAVLWVVPSV